MKERKMGAISVGANNARFYNKSRRSNLRSEIGNYARVFVGLGVLLCMWLGTVAYEKAREIVKGVFR